MLVCLTGFFVPALAADTASPTHRDITVEGWTVRVELALEKLHPETATAALRELTNQLYRVSRVVPEPALGKLRKVRLWLGIEDELGRHKCAAYHPSREWLVANRYNPELAESVELANAANFVKWTHDQPWMVMHELAHAYHHQVVTHQQEGVLRCYEAAVASGRYQSVGHIKRGRTRAYALNNPQEYFAEATEAFFGTNDFYPYVRSELKEHDPEMFKVLEEVWGTK